MGENLRNLNNVTVDLVKNHSTELDYIDKNLTYNKDQKLNKFLEDRGNSYSQILGSVDNILENTADIQKKATHYTKYAYNVLDKNTQYLTELNDDVQSNINNLNIQKDNKKRIIQMQRNRLLKYKFIKQTLLYLLVIILVCGIVLYLEKLLGETIKPFSSILLVAIISIFIIFLIFRYVDYNRRSKFNFKQYNINAIGDKYDKTVFEYDRDKLNFMGNSALDLIDDNISQGAEAVKSSISDSDK